MSGTKNECSRAMCCMLLFPPDAPNAVNMYMAVSPFLALAGPRSRSAPIQRARVLAAEEALAQLEEAGVGDLLVDKRQFVLLR